MSECKGGGQLEERGRMRPALAELVEAGQDLRGGIPRNHVPVDKNPFAKVAEVRRCVEPGSEAGCADDGIQHRADRAFAIGPGDMEDPEAVLRISEVIEKPSGVVQPELDAEELRVVEPRQRLVERHFAEK